MPPIAPDPNRLARKTCSHVISPNPSESTEDERGGHFLGTVHDVREDVADDAEDREVEDGVAEEGGDLAGRAEIPSRATRWPLDI